jgi:hypothetical protein
MRGMMELGFGLVLGLWIGFMAFVYEFYGPSVHVSPIPNMLFLDVPVQLIIVIAGLVNS